MKYILTISLFIVSSFTFIYAEFDTEDHNIFYPNQSMINSSFNDTKTHIKLYTRHQFYNGLKVGDGIISEFDAVSQNYTVFPENAHLQTLHFDFTVSPLNLTNLDIKTKIHSLTYNYKNLTTNLSYQLKNNFWGNIDIISKHTTNMTIFEKSLLWFGLSLPMSSELNTKHNQQFALEDDNISRFITGINHIYVYDII